MRLLANESTVPVTVAPGVRGRGNGSATGGTTPPGTGHRVLAVSPRRRGEAYDVVARAVAAGHAIPLYVGVRLLREDADRIVGRAGRRSPCAAQGLAGLASVGAVDDKPRSAEAGA